MNKANKNPILFGIVEILFIIFFLHILMFSPQPEMFMTPIGNVFLLSLFIILIIFTSFSSAKLLKWNRITYWIFAIMIYIPIIVLAYSKILPYLEEIVWNEDTKVIWITVPMIILSQFLLIILYFGISLFPFSFQRRIAKIELNIRRQSIFNDISLKNIHTYIKAHKYVYYIVCESSALLAVILSWFFGLSPIILIAMLAEDYAFPIIFLGNILLMSIITMFITAYVLKKKNWLVWCASIILCLVCCWLFYIGYFLNLEEIAITFGLIFIFSLSFVISQIILLFFYYSICYLSKSLKSQFH